MRLWAKSEEASEGKFLVVRRDGSVPAWPHFVIGARDPASSAALRAYAAAAKGLGYDSAYVADIEQLAQDFEEYRAKEGEGDPDARPHRVDDLDVLLAMRGQHSRITVWPSKNAPKT